MTRGLEISSFYLTSVYTFVVPEILTDEKKARKWFRHKALETNLKRALPPPQGLSDFSNPKPVFIFNQPTRSGYNDEYWELFWNRWAESFAHYPYEMRLKGPFLRLSGTIDAVTFRPIVKARLFPYGAVSIHVNEYVKLSEPSPPSIIVDYKSLPIFWRDKEYTVRTFMQQIRDHILREVLSKEGNYPRQTPEPQRYVLNPIVDHIPDLDSDWLDIAPLLAMSKEPNHVGSILRVDYGNNLGGKDQLILIGPYSSLLFTPDKPWEKNRFGVRCIRGRMASISELACIQSQYLKALGASYPQVLSRLKSMESSKLLLFLRALKGRTFQRLLDKESDALQGILSLSNMFQGRTTWLNWYQEMAKPVVQQMQSLATALRELQKMDVSQFSYLGSQIERASQIAASYLKGGTPSVP